LLGVLSARSARGIVLSIELQIKSLLLDSTPARPSRGGGVKKKESANLIATLLIGFHLKLMSLEIRIF